MQMHLVVTLDSKAEKAEWRSFHIMIIISFLTRSCTHLSHQMDRRYGLSQVCRAESEARAARDGNLSEIVDGKVHGPSNQYSPTYPSKCTRSRFPHRGDRHFRVTLACVKGLSGKCLWKQGSAKLTQLD